LAKQNKFITKTFDVECSSGKTFAQGKKRRSLSGLSGGNGSLKGVN
jgi:hypothetical protein